MDTILINGLEFYAYHGASDAEQTVGHRYRVDVELSIDARLAGQTDELDDTVCYGQVAQRLVQIGTERQVRLLEALATQMTEAVFANFPPVNAIKLRVQKLCPPMNAMVASVGVEIFREREEMDSPPRVRLTVVGHDDVEEASE